MDTIEKNKIISELVEIYDLYCERLSVEKEIAELPSRKEEEKNNIIEPKIGAIKTGSVKRKWVEKFLKKVVSADIEGWVYRRYPPRHWKSNAKLRDFGWEKQFNEFASPEYKEKHYNAFREYDKIFLSIVDEYKEKYTAEKERYKEEQEKYPVEVKKYQAELSAIELRYENIAKDLLQKKDEILKKLDVITIISEEFVPDSKRIADMLKNGRADTLKEAINMVCDEKRKDSEEAQRRIEAARREAILEQQAYDNRMHNEAMQRAAEAEARAAQAQATATAQSYEFLKREIEAQCATCMRHGNGCPYGSKNPPRNCNYYDRR